MLSVIEEEREGKEGEGKEGGEGMTCTPWLGSGRTPVGRREEGQRAPGSEGDLLSFMRLFTRRPSVPH